MASDAAKEEYDRLAAHPFALDMLVLNDMLVNRNDVLQRITSACN